MVNLRGNLNTRIAKLEQEDYDAIIVAAAGLNRLKIQDKLMVPIPFDIMLPAVGQGALAIECRIEDNKVNQLVKKLNYPPTELVVTAERAFLAAVVTPSGLYKLSKIACHTMPPLFKCF